MPLSDILLKVCHSDRVPGRPFRKWYTTWYTMWSNFVKWYTRIPRGIPHMDHPPDIYHTHKMQHYQTKIDQYNSFVPYELVQITEAFILILHDEENIGTKKTRYIAIIAYST